MLSLDTNSIAVVNWVDGIEYAAEAMPLAEIGQILVADVRETIESEGYGSWEPRKEPTGSWPLLRKSGSLYGSFSYSIDGETSVSVSSGVGYDGYLNAGTRKMPAREFYALSPDAEQAIEDLIYQHFS